MQEFWCVSIFTLL